MGADERHRCCRLRSRWVGFRLCGEVWGVPTYPPFQSIRNRGGRKRFFGSVSI
jgi:hypothetical protein